jgi:uncharacterized repeat protein (TIGR03803 family)
MSNLRRFTRCRSVVILAGLQIISWACAPAGIASEFTTLYRFDYFHGHHPNGLVRDNATSTLYGTTLSGGKNGYGVVFTLTPPEPGKSRWREKTLHAFAYGDESPYRPSGPVLRADDGTLYGTAGGGKYFGGTVYSLTPPAPGRTKWKEKVLFNGSPYYAASPQGKLVQGLDGTLYGVTYSGGTGEVGTLFSVSPPVKRGTPWIPQILHNFQGRDGAYPNGSLVMDHSGVLYGTSMGGRDGFGTVFSVAPPPPGKYIWSEQVLHSFAGSRDGVGPKGGLLLGNDGTLYGTADGGFGHGMMFALTPPPPGKTKWKRTLLYSFRGAPDGDSPNGGLIMDDAGVLYGTTYLGGDFGIGRGTVFSLTPPPPGQTKWTEKVLYRFTGGDDGWGPLDGLVSDNNGAFYGTTAYGPGDTGEDGTVFKLVP